MSRNETPPQRTAGKRPLRALTPSEKLDAIKRVHEGESKASVARDIGVPESTLRGWCKAEHKIVNQVTTMKNSGSFERLSSPSESDRSTPGSSSRPPSANLTGASTSTGIKESSEEVEPPTKRMKIDNDMLSASTSSVSSSSIKQYDQFNSVILSLLMNNMINTNMITSPSTLKQFYDQQVILNANKIFTTPNLLEGSGYSSLGYPANNMSFNNVSMMSSTLPNMINPQRDINGKKTRHRVMSTSLGSTFDRTSKKQSLSPTERINNSVPSTSSGIVNGNHIGSTMSKLSQDGKNIDDIAYQLLLREQSRQQQLKQVPVNINSTLPSREAPFCSSLDGQPVPNNSVKNYNNNNIHKNNNQIENRKHSLPLPPGIHEAAEHGIKFLAWLRESGSIFTFEQIKCLENIMDNLVEWIKSREIKLNDKSNSTS
ncbi:uncharacterized protein Dan [Anoplolepis gracilipes]|uniref:uncharacterized protein Dan n=1 Tax=Anoplolepis gracilipes TaxID=354296 RepID=UPI003B9F29DF